MPVPVPVSVPVSVSVPVPVPVEIAEVPRPEQVPEPEQIPEHRNRYNGTPTLALSSKSTQDKSADNGGPFSFLQRC